MAIRQDWPAEVSAQEIFDHAVRHMAEQGERCVDRFGSGDCVYRGPSPGTACALGALLTDEEATKVLEKNRNGASAHGLLDCGLLPQRLIPHIDLCAALQRVHDAAAERPLPPRALAELASIADRFDLQLKLLPREVFP
jgi:hypothetical protein